jgi:hypothetical protein
VPVSAQDLEAAPESGQPKDKPMPWWLDLLLLAFAATLWCSGSANADDVWSLFQKVIAAVALAVVLLGGRQILLEFAALGLALWLPSARRFQ